MSCGFINKYIDKLYTGEISYFDSKALKRHMESCDECRSLYMKITGGNSYIKEKVLDVDVPPSLTLNLSRNLGETGKKRHRMSNIKRYIAAAAVLILLISSSVYLLYRTNGLANPYTNSGPDTAAQNPVTKPADSELTDALKKYIKAKEGKTNKGGQVFVALDIFGAEEKDGHVKVYLWALIEEYAWVQGLIPGSGRSIPMVVELEKKGNTYDPQSFSVPRDGTYYPEDVKKLFPGKYRDRVMARQGKVYDMEQEIKQEAMEYFKNNTTPQNGATINDMIVNFLGVYGWHPNGEEYIQNVKIPLTFVDKPGEFPVGLYWAYNNVLSKSIGYDIERYKGMDVTAHIIPLKEEFGDSPNKNIRAIVIEVAGSIGGAWLDRGRHYTFLASLDKKYFADIAGKSWGQWLKDEGLVDYSPNGYEGKLTSLSPEEVITRYYEAIDKKDYTTAYSLMTKSNQAGYLFANMPDEKLYNDGFDCFTDGMSNTLSVKVLGIKPWDGIYQIQPDKLHNRQVFDTKEFMADTDMTFKQEITSSSGSNPRFIQLVKETSDAPWLIDAIGTGP